ncbi:MAG: DNA-processing protein DprA [Verrucomicrobiae bacterium]|nr:DNA-processing protein DprA [Verrucomicrobiae bacterium]
MERREAWIVLNLISGIGPVRVRRLLEHLGEPQRILQTAPRDLERIAGIGPETARAIADWEQSVNLKGELDSAQNAGVTILTADDADYPENLREIHDPPLVLYMLGKMDSRDVRSIGVVGSRETSHYGTETAKRLSYQMAFNGIPVISGLARGIDTAAHQGALAAKGRTVAVIGSGLGEMYPPENEPLARKIIEGGGAVISEFPMGMKPQPQNFPMRNRIVSGMSIGTLVVEAGLRSGALITARMALDQGRTLFAVPGRIDSPRSKGTHALIKEGAHLVEEVEDVIRPFGFLFPPGSLPENPSSAPSAPGLSESESVLYGLLEGGDLHMDVLIEKSGLSAPVVSSTLLALELKKIIRQLPGRHFTRTR